MELCNKKHRPCCAYCVHGSRFSDTQMLCPHKGMVDDIFKCRKFAYDPLKRVPPRPVTLKKDYTADDFKI